MGCTGTADTTDGGPAGARRGLLRRRSQRGRTDATAAGSAAGSAVGTGLTSGGTAAGSAGDSDDGDVRRSTGRSESGAGRRRVLRWSRSPAAILVAC